MQQHTPNLSKNDTIMRGSASLADLVRLAINYSKYQAVSESVKKKRTHDEI